jgi:hypothetical protein
MTDRITIGSYLILQYLLLFIAIIPNSSNLSFFQNFSKQRESSNPEAQTLTLTTENAIFPDERSRTIIKTFSSEYNDFIDLELVAVFSSIILKGENAHLNIQFKSLETIDSWTINIALVCVPSNYGPYYQIDKNQDGVLEPLIFDLSYTFDETISEGQMVEKELYFGPSPLTPSIPFNQIPLNRGQWIISTIEFSSEGFTTNIFMPTSDLVITVAFNPYKHVAFLYFQHTFQNPFPSDETIRDYLDQAIFRLENNYSFSIKLFVITEDSTWDPPEEIVNASDFKQDAWNHVGQQLSLKDQQWDHVHGYDFIKKLWTGIKPFNGGYDILTFATDRLADVLGVAAVAGNWAFASGGHYEYLGYHIQPSSYDNILQHELSHVFGAHDRDASGTIMDTQLEFKNNRFTSPCLEETHYLQEDRELLQEHSCRFDGDINPTPLTIGRQKSATISIDVPWDSVAVFAYSNQTGEYPSLVLGRMAETENNHQLLYSNFINGFWTEAVPITNSTMNISQPIVKSSAEGYLDLIFLL